MINLSLALRSRGQTGDPLPPVFPQLEALGAKIRRGQVTLVAGAPGGGKTALMSHWAVSLDHTGQGDKSPGIYFSMDTDVGTVGVRTGANVTGMHVSESEKKIKAKDLELLLKISEETEHIHWCFNASPNGKDIEDEIECYGYVHGRWPEWIIFDNLMDLAGEDAVALNSAVDFGKQIAREKSCAVIFLHHTVGEYENGDQPIPLSGLRYKVGKIPRLILTLYRADPNLLGVAIVKNSSGRADPSGNYQAHIPMMLERMWFSNG